MATQNLVICLAEARRSRGMPAFRARSTSSEGTDPAPHQEVAPVRNGPVEQSLEDRAEQISKAMTEWNGSVMMSAEELLPLLLSLVSEIRQDPGMARKTGVPRVDQALEARFGEAHLGRVALMTPQELLALEGVGRTSMDQVIAELGRHGAFSVPELVCGLGKADIEVSAELPDSIRELAAGMPGHAPVF